MSDKQLQQKLDSLTRAAQDREKAKVYQFPLWAEPQRGIPNDFARSALFTAKKIVSNELVRDKEVFCQGGIAMSYTGVSLTQDHLDVYEGIMHIARQQNEGTEIGFTARGMLKLINRQTGGKDHKRLRSALKDLTATAVSIKRDGRLVYWGSLLPEGCEDEESGVFKVVINRRLIKFFEQGFTIIEQKQRKTLARSPLAKHLQCWLSSHKKPYPVTVQYLYDLTGSDAKELKEFRRGLKLALHRLVSVGVLEDWSLDKTDKITFVMPGQSTSGHSPTSAGIQ